MARPQRIEYAGAVYHVMARGNQGRSIFADDKDLRALRWIGQRLGMGHDSRVSQAAGRMKSQPVRKLQALKRRLPAAAHTPA
jgi:hypothetical protein